MSTDRTVREALRAASPRCGAELRFFATADEFLAHHRAVAEVAMAECLIADADATGASVAGALRAAGNGMPVVFVLNPSDPRAAHDAFRAGAWAMVDSPVAADALERAVNRALDYDRWRRNGAHAAARRARAAKLADDLRKASAVELTAQLLHELSQPLTAINAWTGISLNQAKGGADPAALVEPLDRLAREAKRATEILRAFRALSRRLEPEIVACDLNAALAAIVELIEPEAAENGIDLRLIFGRNLPAASADPAMVELAAYILCRNALDVLIERPAGRPRRMVVRSRTEGAEIVASVSDSGPGLDEAMLDRLFKPVASPKTSRSGIGLAVCRAMLEALGGRLWLESNSPAGASFAFALPRS